MSSTSFPSAAPRVRMSLRLRLVGGLGLLSLLIAAVLITALGGVIRLRESAHQAVVVDGHMSRLADQVAIRTLLCRRYEKDFILAVGDPHLRATYLEQWQQAHTALGEAIQEFSAAATSQDDLRRAARWRGGWARYADGFGQVVMAVGAGRITSAEEAELLLAPFKTNIGLLSDQAVEVALEKERTAQLTAATLEDVGNRMVWYLALIGLSALILAGIWSLAFPAWVMRPIAALRAATTRLAEGDLSARVGLAQMDELGALGVSFDHMATTIEQHTSDLAAQHAAAEAARATAEAAHAQIAEQLATIAEQRAVIQEMSVPILPLSAQTLVLPLVGALDSMRLHLLHDRALHALQETSARFLILDITGVPIVDSHVAQGLLHLVQAAQLLGACVVLVGIRPEVAQAIVSLGIRLDSVAVRSTLQSGIAYTLQQRQSGLANTKLP